MARLTVRVTPRAGRDAIDGFSLAGHLRVRVGAAPAEGAANKAVIRVLSRALGVPPSRIAIAADASSRIKSLDVAGLDDAAIRARLCGHNP
jgi:uncharacterized protein YggU (UPF0235/DUF167 family)